MLSKSAFLLLSSAALAMYLAASAQFLDLVFDHHYRYTGLGLAVFGLMLGAALAAARHEAAGKRWFSPSPGACVFAAVVAQLVAGYLAIHLVYGAGWTFLLLAATLALPYLFWGCACPVLYQGSNPTIAERLSMVLGLTGGLLVSPWAVSYADSLTALWLFSAALLAFSAIPLAGSKRLIGGGLSVWIGAGLLWAAASVRLDNYPLWDETRNTVTKPIAVALASQKELQIESTRWLPGMRRDKVGTQRSLKDGFGWWLSNATAPAAFVNDADSRSEKWWLRHFPLLTLPIEVAAPQRMLSIGAVNSPESGFAAHAGVRDHDDLAYSIGDCAGVFGRLCLSGTGDELPVGSSYDLIHLSVPHALQSPWVGVNANDEYLVSSQLLERYLSLLNAGGMLAITAREEVVFAKLLLSVWALLLPDFRSDIMQVKDQVRAFRLNQYAPYKGSYRYLILAAATGFSDEQLRRMKKVSSRIPVEALIYENQAHTPPYRFFDNTMMSRSLDDAVRQFTGYFSAQLRSAVSLESSSLERPGFFHLSRQMHPFLVWLLTGVLAGVVYGMLFSFRGRRDFGDAVHSTRPAIAVFLMQALVSAAGGAFLLAVIVQPMVAATRVPLSGFLLAVCVMLAAAVIAIRPTAGRTGGDGKKMVVKESALVLLIVLVIYASRSSILERIQNGGVETLWLLMSPVIFVLTWFAWRVQQRVVFQIGEFYPVTVAWSWIISALGVLGGVLVSTQIWMRLGWSTVIIWAAVLYAVVLLIGAWVAGSPTAHRHGVIEADSTS